MFKISIVESQSIIREGLFALLSKQVGFDIISSHVDFIGLLREADTLQPDVVFIGLNTVGVNEIRAIEKIKMQFANVKILIFSTNYHEECIRCAFQAGVHGYLHKDSTPTQLCNAVKTVTKGRFYLSTTILPIVLNCFVHCVNRSHSAGKTDLTIRT